MSTHTVTDAGTVAGLPNPQAWFADAPSPATEAQERKKRAPKAKAPTTPTPTGKAKAPAAAKGKAQTPAKASTMTRCRPAISAPRTANGFVPPKGVNYAAAARLHIADLLKSANGRKTVDDVALLTQSLITSGAVPAEYVHRPHVLYWRKQVLGK